MPSLRNILFRPFYKFLQLQASSSLLLLGATAIALFWANSPWWETYDAFWHTPLVLGFGSQQFSSVIHFWINDALMAVFFLLVGLEIKRELLVGELSSPRQAALPIVAALGGMVVPAIIYMLFHPPGTAFFRGWGIPTVTDIAFAIGVLVVLGERIPIGLKIFLTALAIVDDLGAIFLIALFYAGGLQIPYLLAALVVLSLLFLFNRLKMDNLFPYLIVGLALWFVILKTGLHTTIAGVLLAFMIPAKAKIDPAAFNEKSAAILERFRMAGIPADKSVVLTNQEHQASVQELEILCEEVQAPLQQLEHALHPWSSYLILPLFALANAGVHIEFSHLGEMLLHPVTLAILAGLFIGKQAGITLFSWFAVRLGLAELPAHVSWKGVYGAAILGGIGFTMSLFVSLLAFPGAAQVDSAKIGILLASLLSGIAGALVLIKVFKKPNPGEEVSGRS